MITVGRPRVRDKNRTTFGVLTDQRNPVIESPSFTTPHRLCRGDGIFIFHVHPLNLSPEGGSLAMRDTQDAAKRAEIVGAGVPKRRKCVLIARA